MSLLSLTQVNTEFVVIKFGYCFFKCLEKYSVSKKVIYKPVNLKKHKETLCKKKVLKTNAFYVEVSAIIFHSPFIFLRTSIKIPSALPTSRFKWYSPKT